MGLARRAEPGAGHERFSATDRVRFLARAGRLLEGARPDKNIARLTAELFVPRFGIACRVELSGSEVTAFVDSQGEVRIRERRVGDHDEPEGVEPLEALRARLTSSLVRAPIPAPSPGTLTVMVQRGLEREDVLAVRDVARRLGAALERRRLVAEARAAKRHHDELILRASHELRTPLASLSLHLSGLLRAARTGKLGSEPSAPTVERLERADAQLERVLGLIGQLVGKPAIDPNRVEIQRSDMDLSALVREVAERHAAKATERGFSMRVNAERPVIGRWDRELVQRALTNLVAFVLDRAPRGELEIGAHRSTGGARAIVRAKGFVIPASDQAELFRGGLDSDVPHHLGLFIARRIVEEHGGRIRVRSARGKGSEFSLFFPGTEA